MEPSGAAARDGYAFFEPAPDDILSILRLNNDLDSGYLNSPFFMYREPAGEAGFLTDYNKTKPIIIAAQYNGKAIAYIRAELTGETFIRDAPGYLHCSGIYCAPEHRGTGVSQTLLGKLIQKLGALGYTRLGVDFESVNPSGSRFWLKYFTAYTYSVVRRIDEYATEVLKN
jgi:GNAT superfamily N-acetyltransferase